MSDELYDAPNQQVVRADGSGPADEGTGGAEATPQAGNGEMPSRHAGLDELAAERGHEWSGSDLTVAEKQAELGG